MLKSGVVVIHMNLNKNNQDIEYLVGNSSIKVIPQEPYNSLSCEFLNDLSISLRNHRQIREFPDVMAFAFWCRNSNINKLRKEFKDNKNRLGLGMVFHIAPSNVPVNFAFSFVFGLLSGNTNIVRVPSKLFSQVYIICNEINKILENKKYSVIKAMTSFIKYERSDEITGSYSENCNARIIWGGDSTIRNIRKLPIPPRCIDIAFADRFSLSIISSDSIMNINDFELERLTEGFYNDTYLMDQNACSSPHLLIWIGANKEKAQNKFWDSLYHKVKEEYELSPVSAVDKYTLLCENSIELDNIEEFKKFDNLLYILKVNKLIDNIDKYHGKFGHFFEYDTDDINELSSIVNNKYQTLTYYGVDKSELTEVILNNSLLGIDRIVPIGQAMDMTVIWDGYDIVKNLSRIIDVK
jgi:hypothetical protein